MSAQLLLDREHRPTVATAMQSNGGDQPPQSIGLEFSEPCRLKHGCHLLAYGTICGPVCWARITER